MNTVTDSNPATLKLDARALRKIAEDLVELAALDQGMRDVCNRMRRPLIPEIVQDHTDRLKVIVHELGGWPTNLKVDKKAVHAAWLVVYHSEDLIFQEKCLGMMKGCSALEVSMACVAMLEDRVLRCKGLPQRYGTEYKKLSERTAVLYETSDIGAVDKLRQEVGLDTLNQQHARFRATHLGVEIVN